MSPTRGMRDSAYFAVDDVRLSFGGLHVLQGVALHVNQGEIVGLIGPNGAGKTTLFDVISGVHAARGHVWFKGTDLLKRKPYERAWFGLGRTFQQMRMFQNVSVVDCVRTAAHRHLRRSSVAALLRSSVRTSVSRSEERRANEMADEAIERLGLGDYAGKTASELSYGTLRLVELATVLVMQPELVLLDEPSSGIAQRETEALGPLLTELRAELDCTFVVIEHDMPLVMSISDRIYCLSAGVVLAEGTPAEVQTNPEVIEAYLGGSMEVAG